MLFKWQGLPLFQSYYEHVRGRDYQQTEANCFKVGGAVELNF
jgi:hypothetical protein